MTSTIPATTTTTTSLHEKKQERNAKTLPAHRRHRLPLTAVSFVCCMRPGLETLAPTISAFFDPAKRWTIELACVRGDLQLLQRIIAHEASITGQLYRSHMFNKALVHAIRHDNAQELLECLVAYCPNGFASKGMEEAAAHGNVRIMQWLADNCPNLPWSSRFTDNAAYNGHLDALKWLNEYAGADRQWCLANAIQYAAGSGHLEVVKWLHGKADRELIFGYYNDLALKRAIAGGHLEVLKYLQEQNYKIAYNFSWGRDDAVGAGDLETIQWLHKYDLWYCTEHSFQVTNEKGAIDIIQWFLETQMDNEFKHLNGAIQAAATNGDLEILQLLQRFASPACYAKALVGAAANGHLDVVQRVFSNLHESAPRHEKENTQRRAVSHAAANGYMEIAQWVHSQPCERDYRLYSLERRLAMRGLWHDLTAAASNGHLEVAIWLFDNVPESWDSGRSSQPRRQFPINAAAEHGHLHVVKWLHENNINGCTREAMDLAAKNNHLHVVKWLHENHREGCTTRVMDAVASLEMVQWLHANRTEDCTTQAMANAAKNGDFEMLLFLHEHRSEGCDVDVAK